MLTDYFRLQITLLHRRFRAWRVAPWLVWGLGGLLFLALSLALLRGGKIYAWAYVALGIYALRPLSGAARNDFLRRLYRPDRYRKIRLSENVLGHLPFVVLLLSQLFWARSLVLCGIGIAMVFYVARPAGGRSLPTPFGRRPFEFTVNFRRIWWVVLGLLGLLVQAIRVGNFELGAFALAAGAIAAIQGYAEPEPADVVYAHVTTPAGFLHGKFRIAARHLSIWLSPFVLPLLIAFPERYGVVLIVLGLAYLNQAMAICLKYYRFPHRQTVMEGFVFAGGLFLPPLLPVLLYLYYRRALVRIQPMLP